MSVIISRLTECENVDEDDDKTNDDENDKHEVYDDNDRDDYKYDNKKRTTMVMSAGLLLVFLILNDVSLILTLFTFLPHMFNNLLMCADKCHMAAASECMAMCSECSINTQRFNLVALTPSDEENIGEEENDMWEILRLNMSHSSKKGPPEEVIRHYWLEGLRSSDEWENIR